MPEHPTNLTFGSVWEEKDRCVLLTIALGSNYLHSRKIVKNKNTIIVFSTHEIFLWSFFNAWNVYKTCKSNFWV